MDKRTREIKAKSKTYTRITWDNHVHKKHGPEGWCD